MADDLQSYKLQLQQVSLQRVYSEYKENNISIIRVFLSG